MARSKIVVAVSDYNDDPQSRDARERLSASPHEPIQLLRGGYDRILQVNADGAESIRSFPVRNRRPMRIATGK